MGFSNNYLLSLICVSLFGLFFFFLLSASVVIAQNVETISGIVTDHSDNPLPGATVLILDNGEGTSTDNNGRFSLRVPPGEYTIQVSYIGFQILRTNIEVVSGQSSESFHFFLRSAIIGGNEIVVLGSRRGDGRSITESSVPVDVITAQEIEATGLSQTTQIIRALVPSFNSPDNSVSDGTDHVRPATLRGLGPDQTLILINGKRRHTSAILHINATVGRGSTGVDLNAIPANMIERIVVLRDGASAQYGSDAIAGVINIILKSNVGLDASLSYGQYASYEKRGYGPNQALPESGENSRTADFQSLPYYSGVENVWRLDGKTLNFHTGYGFELPNNGRLYVSVQVRDKGRTNRSGLDPRPNYSELENGSPDPRELTFDRNNHRFGSSEYLDISGFLNGSMEISQNAEFYAFGGINARNGISGGYYRGASDSRNVPEYYPDGFLPLITSNIFDGSVTVGLKGNAGSWNYDVSQVYGRNILNYGVTNSVNASMGVGSPTTFKAGTLGFDQATTNLDVVRTVDIGTFRPLSVAAGAEYRYELYRILKGEAASYADGGNGAAAGSQVFPGYSPRNEQNENRFSAAAYLDLETDLTKRWTVGLAGRVESYSDFGNTVTGKFTNRFQLIDGFAWRGAVSTGFRAPSLAQSYFTSIATTFQNDVAFEVGTFPVNSAAAIAMGAEPLDAETSINLSTGLTFDRGDFLLTADLYQIDINSRIVMTENFLGDGVPDFLASQGINATGGRYFTNAVDSRTRGIDIVARQGVIFNNSSILTLTLGINLNKTNILNEDEIQTPPELQGLTDTPLFGPREVGRFEESQPGSTVNGMANYSANRWNILIRFVRYGEFTEFDRNPDDNQIFGAVFLTDLEYTYKLNNRFHISIGSNNIFDVYPDKTYQGNSYYGIFPYSKYSPSGFDGRYLYSRISLSM